MKKPDELPKQHPFNVPDQYFDRLPGRIQSRLADRRGSMSPVFAQVMRYGLAMFIVAALAFVWLWTANTQYSGETPEDILAGLETADLVAYLNDGDITTDELLDEIQLSSDDADQIEDAVFMDDLNDMDLNSWIKETD